MKLPKRAQMLFCSMVEMIELEKKYGRGGNKIFSSDMDKELSKKDCFKRVTEEGR